jgi:hypothetical protein
MTAPTTPTPPSWSPPPSGPGGGTKLVAATPATLIMAVVLAVGLLGGGGLLIGRLTSKDHSGASNTQVATGANNEVQATEDTVPPTRELPTTTTTESRATTTSSLRATTTTARPTTTSARSSGAGTSAGGGTSGGAVEVAEGVTFTPAPGWRVWRGNGGIVQVFASKDGAILELRVGTGYQGSSADAVLSNYAKNALSRSVTDLQTSTPTPMNTGARSVVSTSYIDYEGNLVGNNGSTRVGGFVLVLLRNDGVVVIYDATHPADAWPKFKDDFLAMLGSVLRNL